MSRSTLSIALAVLVACGPLARRAEAAETPSVAAERLKREGFRRFAAGDHEGAVEAMQQAYDVVPHPDLLFNVAVIRARQPGRCADSLEAFQRFFSACDGCAAEKPARAQHAEVLARCTAVAAPPASAPPVSAPPASAAPVSAAPVSAAPVSAAPVSAAPVSAPPVAPEGLPVRRALGWATLGFGLAAAASGAVAAIQLGSDVDAERAARTMPGASRALVEEHQRDARGHALQAQASFGLAAAAVAGGLLLLLLGGDAP